MNLTTLSTAITNGMIAAICFQVVTFIAQQSPQQIKKFWMKGSPVLKKHLRILPILWDVLALLVGLAFFALAFWLNKPMTSRDCLSFLLCANLLWHHTRTLPEHVWAYRESLKK